MQVTKDFPDSKLLCSEIVYAPVPLLRYPVTLLFHMLRDLIAARHLAYRLLVRNLASQYRQSLFGYVWAVIPPVAGTAGFVFLNSTNVLKTGETNVPYAIYVFSGIILWQTFTDAFHAPLRWISVYRSVLTRVNFPREALILGALGEVILNLVVRIVLLVMLLVWFNIGLVSTAVFAPFAVLALVGLGLMMGILITPLGILYGDVEKGTSLLTMLWFFLTPIIYPPPMTGQAILLNQLNPVSPLLTTARELLLTGSVTQLNGFLTVSILNVLCLFIGWLLFRLALPHLVERLSH